MINTGPHTSWTHLLPCRDESLLLVRCESHDSSPGRFHGKFHIRRIDHRFFSIPPCS